MWYVYILECSDKTFYTGICKDLAKRVLEHNGGDLGAKYTRGRRPVRLVYSAEFGDRSLASKEEFRIKRLSKEEKTMLISGKA
jgi:putative endonuclease